MKNGGSFLGVLILIVIAYVVVGSMQPKFEELNDIREKNGVIALIFFTGEDTYVYQADEPHAVFIEFTDKKFVWWKLKYRYEVKYVPCTLNGQHSTWDPERHEWGEPLDEIIHIDNIN